MKAHRVSTCIVPPCGGESVRTRGSAVRHYRYAAALESYAALQSSNFTLSVFESVVLCPSSHSPTAMELSICSSSWARISSFTLSPRFLLPSPDSLVRETPRKQAQLRSTIVRMVPTRLNLYVKRATPYCSSAAVFRCSLLELAASQPP